MATNNTVNRIELIEFMGTMPEMRFTANGLSVTNSASRPTASGGIRTARPVKRLTGIA
jgi:hypothetical protein